MSDRDLARSIARQVSSSNPGGVNLSRNRETNDLARAITRNFTRSTGRHMEEQDSGPGGILGAALDPLTRVLDVMSRPLYGVANAIDETMEGGNPVEGLWKGISGKEKTTFSDVLDEAGVENGVLKGVLGFGLDVALDPTTYIGAGVVKQVTKEALETAGARAAAEAVGTKAAKETVKLVGDDFISNKAKGVVDVIGGKKTAMKEAEQAIAYEAKLAAEDALLKRAGPGRVNLRVFGKDTGVGSEALYRLGRKAADYTKATRTGKAFNKAFRPTATFVAGTNDTRRILDSQTMAKAERVASVFAKGGKIGDYEISPLAKLTSEERKQVSHALENADIFESLPEHLKKSVEDVRYLWDRMLEEEAAAGIRTLDDAIDNYADHHFDRFKNANDEKAVTDWKRSRKAESRDLRKSQNDWIKKTRKNLEKKGKSQDYIDKYIRENIPRKESKLTLQEAIHRGLEPEEDIAKIVGNRILDHSRQMAQSDFDRALAAEFGVKLGDEKLARKLGLRTSDSKFIDKDIYFPKEIENAIRKHKEFFFSAPEAGSEIMHLYDNLLGKLKFFQTAANPGHHVRNFMGDVSLNALDGLVRAKPYEQAFGILRAVNRPDSFLHTTSDLAQAFSKEAREIRIPVGGLDMGADEVYNYFLKGGGKSGFFRSEIAEGSKGIVETIRKGSEFREDFGRLAHFIHAFDEEIAKQGAKKNLDEAAKKAGGRVRKFNFDYGDLTPLEQRTLKRVVPFYTFMRKNVPMQVEAMFMRPGRQLLTPKFVDMVNHMMGDDNDIDILGLNALPDYMRQAMAVNLIGEGEGRNGVYWNPSSTLPLLSLRETFGHGGSIGDLPRSLVEGQLANITPAAQIPLQQITGHNFFTGRPSNQSLPDQLINLIPAGRNLNQIGEENNSETLDLLNWLTGAGVQEVHPGMIQGELRRQEDIIQALLRRRREERQGGG